MIEQFSEEQVIATVTRLTRSQLVGFIEAAFVRPERVEAEYVFRRVDIARLELLCDLSEELELDETALTIVLSLLDQLHAARHELTRVAQAIDIMPEELRRQIMRQVNYD